MAPIVVEVEHRFTMCPLAAVYDRVDHQRLLGQGRFFEREDLENWGDSRVSNIIGFVAGVSVDRGRIILNSNCRGTPLYYVDGMPLRMGAESSPSGRAAASDGASLPFHPAILPPHPREYALLTRVAVRGARRFSPAIVA